VSEAFDDSEIAPILADIAQRCENHGMGFFAAVEYNPGEFGRTITLQADSDLMLRLCNLLAKSRTNIDALFLAIEKYARARGHNSVYLTRLGIPTQPEQPE